MANNSAKLNIDFRQLMNELIELEKKQPDNPEISELKAKVQKELDRRNAALQQDSNSVSDDSSEEIQGQEMLEVLDRLYASAEANQKKSSSDKSHRHHSSHSSHHRSSTHSGRHHRHHVRIASPSSIPADDIKYEDLIYQEDTNTKAKKHHSSSSARRNTAEKSGFEHSEPTNVSQHSINSTSKHSTASSHTSTVYAGAVSHEDYPNEKLKKTALPKSCMSYKKDIRGWKSLRKWQKAVSIVFGTVLLLVLCGTLSFQHIMNRINHIDSDEIPDLSKEGYEDLLKLSPKELEALRDTDPDAESLIIDKKDRYGVGSIDITPMQRDDVLNILLIGQDRRKGDKGQMRSDSMILVTIDKSTKEMKLTSLMRDMYVPVPGYGYGMINATLLNGGMKLLNSTIEQNFGVHIDGDIQIDFNRFIKLMDLIGPITLDLNADEVTYFKEANGWSFVKGLNELTSEQVLAYARTRSVGRSDWERTDRQRKVIMAIYSKLKKADIPSLIQFAYNAMPLITTNIPKNTGLINIVYTILSNRMPISESHRIPIEGTYTQQIKEGVLHVLVPELWCPYRRRYPD